MTFGLWQRGLSEKAQRRAGKPREATLFLHSNGADEGRLCPCTHVTPVPPTATQRIWCDCEPKPPHHLSPLAPATRIISTCTSSGPHTHPQACLSPLAPTIRIISTCTSWSTHTHPLVHMHQLFHQCTGQHLQFHRCPQGLVWGDLTSFSSSASKRLGL